MKRKVSPIKLRLTIFLEILSNPIPPLWEILPLQIKEKNKKIADQATEIEFLRKEATKTRQELQKITEKFNGSEQANLKISEEAMTLKKDLENAKSELQEISILVKAMSQEATCKDDEISRLQKEASKPSLVEGLNNKKLNETNQRLNYMEGRANHFYTLFKRCERDLFSSKSHAYSMYVQWNCPKIKLKRGFYNHP